MPGIGSISGKKPGDKSAWTLSAELWRWVHMWVTGWDCYKLQLSSDGNGSFWILFWAPTSQNILWENNKSHSIRLTAIDRILDSFWDSGDWAVAVDSKAPPAKPPLNSMPGSQTSDFLKLLHARWRQELKKCNPKAPAVPKPSGLLLPQWLHLFVYFRRHSTVSSRMSCMFYYSVGCNTTERF